MTKPKPKSSSKSAAKPEPKAKVATKSKSEPKAETKVKAEPKAEAKIMAEPKTAPRRRSPAPAPAASKHPARPRAVTTPDEELVIDATPDQPFEEGAHDMISSDLRHRMISEAAYYRYAQRGYADGYDVDDWMAAEAEVDHLLLSPPSD